MDNAYKMLEVSDASVRDQVCRSYAVVSKMESAFGGTILLSLLPGCQDRYAESSDG